MNLYILDTTFKQVAILDQYESFIWTDRYSECGDFEVYTTPYINCFNYLVRDNYIVKNDSEHVMIIEDVEITSSKDKGDRLKITGRSLESLLERRIIWGQRAFEDATVGTVFETLINENLISPEITDRRLSNFVYQTTNITDVTDQVISVQYVGDNLYNVISDLCKSYNIGFKVVLNSSNQFVFSLYKGEDRTYEQTSNPYVLFSSRFDNIINSDYYESYRNLKNVALVLGEEREDNSDKKYRVSQPVYGNQVSGTYPYLQNGVFTTETLGKMPEVITQKYATNNKNTMVADGFLYSTYKSGRSNNDDTESIFYVNEKVPLNKFDSVVVKIYYTGRAQPIQDYQMEFEPRFGIAATRDRFGDPNFITSTITNTTSSAVQTIELSLASYNSQKTTGYFHIAGIGTWRVTEIIFYKYVKTGIERRELFVDARDISSSVYDSEGADRKMSDAQYTSQLGQRGVGELSGHKQTQTFDGQVEATQQFVYKRDFNMGDIVQIENKFGMEGTARITEYIYSENRNGIETYPTFEAIN